jgi:glutamyl-tRNA synthetase
VAIVAGSLGFTMSSSDSRPFRVRFAPSPTGYLHVGGARTALYNWIVAKQRGGTFVLRIEDTDEARNRPEWTTGIIDALAWIGIEPGPHFEGPYYQSALAADHLAAAARLITAGNAYYCDCTQEVVKARVGENGGYDGHCRDRGLEPGPGRPLRFRVTRPGSTTVVDLIRGEPVFDHEVIEDFVLLRGNGSVMFLLANVVDDITMGITMVVRAEEHLPNTPKQQMLWQALGQEPPTWAHVPLLVNEKRQKLSKRRDPVAMEMYRDEGYLPDAMRNYLMLLGWSPPDNQEMVPWSLIESAFALESVNSSPAFFDVKKLRAMNAEYIRAMSVSEFVEACSSRLRSADAPWPAELYSAAAFEAVAPVVQLRTEVLNDVPAQVAFLFTDVEPLEDEWAKSMKEPAAALLDETISAYESLPWTVDALKGELEAIAARREINVRKVQAPVRMAVTGRMVGIPLFEALEVLGRDRTLSRLRAARARL